MNRRREDLILINITITNANVNNNYYKKEKKRKKIRVRKQEATTILLLQANILVIWFQRSYLKIVSLNGFERFRNFRSNCESMTKRK